MINNSRENSSVDMHTHSTASDGSLNPTQLIRLAKEAGISAVALTDHDTIEGLAEAGFAAKEYDIDFVPGIEISCDFEDRVFHILGLFVDYTSPILIDTLTDLVSNRDKRNHQLISRLSEFGINIEYDHVNRIAGNSVVGRPHFAQAMLKKGYVRSINEAFTEYLGMGRKAYIPKKRLTAKEGIELINQSKGIACLAHPMVYPFEGTDQFKNTILILRHFGMRAIEVYYSEHTPDQTKFIERVAGDFNLLSSGGSDFHGGNIHPENKIGTGVNRNLNIGRDIYLKLREAAAGG